MISQVEQGQGGVHSRGRLNKYPLIKYMKIFYYKLIMKLYQFMGNKCLSYAYVNSTWTLNHMKDLWNELYNRKKLSILYPPCSTALYREASKNHNRKNIIVSFAQFRPEKRQDMQIDILNDLKDQLVEFPEFQDLELHIIGGVRNKDDEQILENLKMKASQSKYKDYIKFLPNGSTEQIIEEMAQAKIGIHTMIAEHFGITLIEMMAAGLILVTHKSAGAEDDILKNEGGDKPGFLVKTKENYVEQLYEIIINYNEISSEILNSAKRRAEKFSDEAFQVQFNQKIKEFLL
jgi:alpha-1,2-mannosyltransferase